MAVLFLAWTAFEAVRWRPRLRDRLVERIFPRHRARSSSRDDSMLHLTGAGRGCLPEDADEARRPLELQRTLAESAERA